jgi:hypothetical protein
MDQISEVEYQKKVVLTEGGVMQSSVILKVAACYIFAPSGGVVAPRAYESPEVFAVSVERWRVQSFVTCLRQRQGGNVVEYSSARRNGGARGEEYTPLKAR